MGTGSNSCDTLRTAAQSRVIKVVDAKCEKVKAVIEKKLRRRIESILSNPEYLAAKN